MSPARSASIGRRLMFGLTVVIVASVALVVALIAGIAPRYEEGRLRTEIAESSLRLAQMLEPPLWELDLDRAELLAQAFANDKRVVRISVREAVSGASREVVRSGSTDTIAFTRTVRREGRDVGEVSLWFDRGTYRAQIRRDVQIALAVSLIALAASLIGVRLLLHALLVKPLTELSDVVNEYAAGDYTTHENAIGTGELRTFSTVLSAMGQKLVHQLRELQEGNARLADEVRVRQQAEAALRLEGAALQAAANAIVITDRSGLVVRANAAFSSFTGYSHDEVVGHTLGTLSRSGVHDRAFYAHLWNTILAGDSWHGEITNRRKDGSLYTEEMTITPLRDASGAITHFIAVKQDVTQRLKLEAQLRQVQRLESVGRLAGGVAHDFNNMLSVIIGHAENALLSLADADPLHADVTEICKAAHRSASLTRQLLAFARQQEVVPQVLDLNATVTDSLKMLQRLIGDGIALEWEPSSAIWPIMMDPSQLDQILANLCINARDAIGEIGEVRIATANRPLDATSVAGRADVEPGDYVVLTVSDNGCGMTADVQAQIFEPFFTTKPVGEGTGLGLATVYGAVAQNHGFLSVSSAPGEGTTFEVHLPRHVGAAAVASTANDAKAAERGSETILLVEDEPSLLRLTTRSLEQQGYVVIGAPTPHDAIRLAEEHAGRIDLLLTDVMMPGMNGRDLAAMLTARHPGLRQLFMSGFSMNLLSGAGSVDLEHSFIAKPFRLAALATKVREVLDRAS